MEEYQPLTSSDPNVQVMSLYDDEAQLITVGFDYNWFGGPISVVCLSSNGQINMGNACDSSFNLKAIGSYNAARIAFVQEDIDPPEGGSVKYLVKSSPSSLKISFEDVKFYPRDGLVQAQVELFPNGDILFCYGEGDMASNRFAAGVETQDAAYPIPDSPFNAVGITSVWPTDTCWRFQMP